ncbi:MAG: hypothetical protein MR639_08875 [Clostridium sp.]|uniref:hypothetical protein n=1 Tax=Clostridium sp. TaxID=1506 RepID=UPI002A8D0D21|nr:hypothetical protein [Clostridium sp.]MDY5096695.1 hypothetical protein [Clostridium sp.]
MGIKDFANKLVEKQKESNKKIKESIESGKEQNELRKAETEKKIEEINARKAERDLKYKEKQEELKLEREKLKNERKEIINNLKQPTDVNKSERQLKKEAQKKEFERIMASNPTVDTTAKPITINTVKTDNVVRCPKCGSLSITSQKKGFGLAKGAAGVLATGSAYGAIAAGIGKNKILITCLNCGYRWKPGKN